MKAHFPFWIWLAYSGNFFFLLTSFLGYHVIGAFIVVGSDSLVTGAENWIYNSILCVFKASVADGIREKG